MTPLIILLQIVVTVLTADFVAGTIHWAEDTYVREDTPVVGKLLAKPNIVHHHYPRYFTKLTWWQSSWDLCLLAGALVLGAWALGCLTWQVWLFAALSANANQIHKWAHQTRKENGPVISFLQDIKLMQTPQHHALHHTDPKSTHYCTITNVLNPLLERLCFWEAMETVLLRTTGLQRREDTSVAGHGPGPQWLQTYRRRPGNTSGH